MLVSQKNRYVFNQNSLQFTILLTFVLTKNVKIELKVEVVY